MKDGNDQGRDRKRSQENEKTSGKKKQSSSKSDSQTNSKKSSNSASAGSNINSDEDDDDDDDDSEAEDEKDDVSRALFFYADELITNGLTIRGQEIELLKALKAVEKCIFLFLNDNPLLQKMLKVVLSFLLSFFIY
jgi:TATA-binding protein-associated factor Taf7